VQLMSAAAVRRTELPKTRKAGDSRIPVELVVRRLAGGAGEKAMLQAYPGLSLSNIHSALRYAAHALAHEEVLLSGAG
jgi:hypothetical protein